MKRVIIIPDIFIFQLILDCNEGLISSNMKKLHEILDCEETLWKQRSRDMLAKEGDRNTRYFHLSTSKRKCVHSISTITII